MSLFFDNSHDHGNNNRMLVHSSEQVNAEQMAKRGFFINVQPVAKSDYVDDIGGVRGIEQWQQPPPPTLLALSRGRNNLNISPAESKRESFAKTTSMKRNIISDCLKPICNFLRAMGVLPLSRDRETGEFRFRLQSPVMVYSMLIFVGLLIYSGFIFIERINSERLGGRFEETVIAYLFIVNLLPIIIILLMWYECGKVAAILNDWMDFEIIYSKTVGKELRLSLASKSRAITFLLPLLSAASVFITHFVIRDKDTTFGLNFIFQIAPHCYLETLTYMIGAYWYLACECLSTTANVLAKDFQKTLKSIGPASVIADYRSLWLRLSKLTRDTGTSTCFTFTFLNLYLFFVITLSVYGLMAKVSDGLGTKDIGLTITVLCSVCLLFFICDEGHNASFNVKKVFQKKILMVELAWLNADATVEINMFLRATEMNKASMNLGGFFDVDRNLFKSLMATMVTYLVVLLQFQFSIPLDDNLAVTKSKNNMSSTDIQES